MEEGNMVQSSSWKNPRFILKVLALVILGAIIVASILRERIVRDNEDTVTVTGRGKVSYQPDTAVVALGVKVENVAKAEEALNKLNDSTDKIIAAVKALGIPDEDIKTQTYSLAPHYEYSAESRNSSISGYDADQQLVIKAKGIDKDPGLSGRVIAEAGKAGSNQVIGVSFDISNLEELKQEARIQAINDAKSKSSELAKAAGIKKLGDVVSWYENIVQSPDNSQNFGYGAGGTGAEKATSAVPAQIPSGTGDIIIEMSVNYRTR
jgi:uncharacterized protein YggE